MSGMVWAVRDEHGTLLGAAVERRTDRDGVMVGDGPYAAISNAFGVYSTLDAAKGLTRAVENESGDAFEYAGYTLGMEHAVMVNEPPSAVEIKAKREAVSAVVGAAEAAYERYYGITEGALPAAWQVVYRAVEALRTLDGTK